MANFDAQLVRFLLEEYFDSDYKKLVQSSGFSKQQLSSWISGTRKPRIATLRWLLSTTVAPEFKVAREFEPVNITSREDVPKELSRALGGHAQNNGVYAFYDSMCTVIYVGKASNGFVKEMYQQLRAPLGVEFPRAVKNSPGERWQATRFISAYEIPHVDHLDYPRHVEALVLRLSKPVGNKVLGRLNFSVKPKDPSK